MGGASQTEHSACGVGFIASRTGQACHGILADALQALRCVEHRGGCAADQVSSDGAGVMTDIPFGLLGRQAGEVAVGSLFGPRDPARFARAMEVFATTFGFFDLALLGEREVPCEPTVLGEEARASLPTLRQVLLRRPAHCRTDASFDKLLYNAKQVLRTKLREQGLGGEFFFASLSPRTIVYKALTRAADLDRFYPDLRDPRYTTRFALIHRRFSTNTRTTWDRAQPFRLIAHNGEINTIAANRSRAVSREMSIGLKADQLVTHGPISDSGSLNEMAEALLHRSSIPHMEDILAIMMPPAEGQTDFYTFWSRAMEPWDGPAIVMYSDGNTVGARLDRNGFRPARWVLTDDRFVLASEAGAFPVDEAAVRRKGIIPAGTGVNLDLATGRMHFRDASQSRENRDAAFDARTTPIGSLPEDGAPEGPVSAFRKTLFTCSREELEKVLYPMIATGREAIGSMGDTARPNVFSSEPRPFFDYFYQHFAQVTNPPLDYLREGNITDLRVFLGRAPNIFFPKDLVPLNEAIELPRPILDLGQMRFLRRMQGLHRSESHIVPRTFPMVFRRAEGLAGFHAAVERLAAEVRAAVEGGTSIVILSDGDASVERPPIPGLIALRAVVHALNESGLRLNASLVMHTAEARTSHHLAALISFGAAAVCPYLALEIARRDDPPAFAGLPPDQRERNLVAALESGLLKIMAKCGISVVQSYVSSKLFTAIGLGPELMETFFPGHASPLGGIGYEELAGDILLKTGLAAQSGFRDRLLHTHQFRESGKPDEGERHSMTSARARRVHRLVALDPDTAEASAAYADYLASLEADEPIHARHLLALREAPVPLPLDQVEPREGILARFGAGAMSFGAVSAESQRDLILAMEAVGGRSNSGEGGENPFYWTDGITASTKQVASARFGVTAEYLISGQEIQIKVAQGAKPGEGGQLMRVKVDASIARARCSLPGVDLISPPPLHDIYSIEDLKELIYELKQVHPAAKVSVKLVSGTGIGTIAVGVAKAGADILYIAGGDGGTGAATLGSMKHAGLPWEFGLLEAHRALRENRLRSQVELRVDGGLLTGRDLVTAAILGAEGFEFGKLLLVAEGCVMARICEKNTCPAGIATHDPKFKARYTGTPEAVARMLIHLAEDVRRHLARLGLASVTDLMDRTDLLEVAPRQAAFVRDRKLDLSAFLAAPAGPGTGEPPAPPPDGVGDLNRRVVEAAQPFLEAGGEETLAFPITTQDRGVLATLSGELARGVRERRRTGADPSVPGLLHLVFTGSAGQGFGAFLTEGLHVHLLGEANDSVGKSMSGGTLALRPHPAATFIPEENALLGNGALYGATGGRFFARGRAGDRFAVRNSGAEAVVEGAGNHACEYMTRGAVAILGPVLANAGAGMTGGCLFLRPLHGARVNRDYLAPVPWRPEDEALFRRLLEGHAAETGSATAIALLADWAETLASFTPYLPVAVAQARETA
ncbi:glutamate synthase [Geothrix rubra]|uniref:Glutamate synthase n=1 Tax=Geothrix rubra TaxID=2927977 RepID=A0ABQ5Q3J9_9BACT|nr:glutamate synthase large subunit [Geothrix rubra]GLH69000.1 glutamate synthase [Geothrix rubra]